MDYFKKIITDIELHSAAGIKECFENGISPNENYRGRQLIWELITGYKRGPSFSECVKVFIEHGAEFDDAVLFAVLMNDRGELEKLITANPAAANQEYSFDCAFTPLYKASLLHICAEFNHLDCAKLLVKHGMDINVKAGIDENGFGGHTPIFHTVNQHNNICLDTMQYFITRHANISVIIKGLIWGKGYEWETFIPCVNPVSYAMMGLLPQFQRLEKNIYETVLMLLKAAYNINYTPINIPNKYLGG